MHHLRIRLRVAEDGTVTVDAPGGLPAGEHNAEVILPSPAQPPAPAAAWAAVRSLQDELARLPVLDPRAPEEILGYDEAGLFG